MRRDGTCRRMPEARPYDAYTRGGGTMELLIPLLLVILLDAAAIGWGADSTRSVPDDRLRDGHGYRSI